MMAGKINIKTIVVLVILLLVGVLGVLGMNTAKTYMSSASAANEPKAVKAVPDVRSATISWMSDKAVMGVVEYGTTPASLLLRAPEASANTNHSVVIKPLKANVNYYFRIRVGDEVFDNGGIPYSFKTKAASNVVEDERTEDAKVTLVPVVTVVPTNIPVSTGLECDSNKDGIVTSMEKLKCGESTPASNSELECDSNKDGIVTSMEKLKCGQN